MQHTAKHS